jgi:hypothetical protein
VTAVFKFFSACTVLNLVLWAYTKHCLSHLTGVMISMFAIGPKVCGFKPNRGDGFLRVIKIRNAPSFRGEVQPEAPHLKILQHVK